MTHGPGWASDYYLCGLAPEAHETGDSDDANPSEAAPGALVDCPTCRTVIDHVRRLFGSSGYGLKSDKSAFRQPAPAAGPTPAAPVGAAREGAAPQGDSK